MGVPFRIADAEAQLAAVRQGLGITTLPCFVGDTDPLLVRGAGQRPAHVPERSGFSRRGGDTQDEARAALHGVRIAQASPHTRPLLAGLSVSVSSD